MRCLFEGGTYSRAALIQGRRLFKNCTRQIYFFYIFIQQYTLYLLTFQRTDTKLIVSLELREKFTRRKQPESFTITRVKISPVRENYFVVVEQFSTFSQFQQLSKGIIFTSIPGPPLSCFSWLYGIHLICAASGCSAY